MIKPRLYDMNYNRAHARWCMQLNGKRCFIEEGDHLEFHIDQGHHSFSLWGDIQQEDGDWYIIVGTNIFFLDHRATYYLKNKLTSWD